MIEKVRAYIEQWHMLPPGCQVFAGVSGGADSVCMLLLLKELSKEFSFHLQVIHVEHGIRGAESRLDAEFVQELCRKLAIPFHMDAVDVPGFARKEHMGLEEAARVLRYRVFTALAGEQEIRVALAHHMEDNAETMLLQMIRGSGIDGLCGIKPVRQQGKICYIRPLLGCSRREIEAYLQEKGQPFREDETNEDLSIPRNRIRRQIIPGLEEINPQAVLHMNRAAEDLGGLRQELEEITDDVEPRVIGQEEQAVLLDVEQLQQLPESVRRRLIYRGTARAAGARKDITRAHLLGIESLLGRQTGSRIHLPYHLTAERSYGKIIISSARKKHQVSESREITGEMLHTLEGQRKVLSLEAGGIRFQLRLIPWNGKIGEIPQKMYTKWMDYDKIKNGFSIRSRRPRDFLVLDKEGHRKKLSDYFITEKIPAQERDHILLLAQESLILWVVGGRMGTSPMVDETTKRVLEITAEKAATPDSKGGTTDGLQQKA